MGKRSISWLHVSDRHLRADTHVASRHMDETMVAEVRSICTENEVHPDFLFFTGDLVWGQASETSEKITAQFDQGRVLLERIMQSTPRPIPAARTFLVPGNHDVNRMRSTAMEQEWLFKQTHLDSIESMILKRGLEWERYSDRLKDYRDFLFRAGLPHLLNSDPTLSYGTLIDTDSASVGIVGVNSAWPCGADVPRDGSHGLVTCLRSQIDRWWPSVEQADCKILLVHHPKAWYSDIERNDVWDHLIFPRFHFSLHGHEHEQLFSDMKNHKSIASGSLYDKHAKQNTLNLVHVDLESRRGYIWVREYTSRGGGGWVPFNVPGKAPERNATFVFDLPDSFRISARKFAPARRTLSSVASRAEHRPDYKVIAFDLDGTLLRMRATQYSWAMIWKELGYSGDIRQFGFQMYENRIINYRQWCEYCRNFFRLKRLTKQRLLEIATENCVLVNGAIDALKGFKDLGIRTAVVSGGLDVVLDACIPPTTFYFDDVFINRTVFDSDGIIQEIIPTQFDFDGKRAAIQEIARKYSISTQDIVFVGDARNDLPVSGHVGAVVAFETETSSPLADVADFVAKDAAALFKYVTGQPLRKRAR